MSDLEKYDAEYKELSAKWAEEEAAAELKKAKNPWNRFKKRVKNIFTRKKKNEETKDATKAENIDAAAEAPNETVTADEEEKK